MGNSFLVISSILSLLSFAIVGWFINGYLPSYMREKGKNTATKEDLQDITEIVESIKQLNAEEIEKLKSALIKEDKLLEKRKDVYEEIVESLGLFIAGNDNKPIHQNRFQSAYSKAWLWAPDSVLGALNNFLDAQIMIASNPDHIEQATVKNLYENIVIEMRKDVGFSNTEQNGFRFFTFGLSKKLSGYK
ncbi:hypothetical protein [Aeromonas hydrophila]|uniref:hypothetical protein n=1 Tax=Aeromonas hydrophila TaxID=644 RepID=UPI00207C86D2|nr:hypothetical protein [Aeromonas hydrophila]MCO4209671.1 hypothetical protein [Aeromonas hydrophila]MCP3287523.1 hypothetical protein [Aeromonas hydrophila]